MTNDQNQTVQSLKDQIQALMAEVEKTNQENAVDNKKVADEVSAIRKEVDAGVDGLEKDLAELDGIEKETSDALDKVILEHAKDAGERDL